MGGSAIVVGAGIAGLVTARVLSEHVDQVTVLERDRLPDAALPRRGAPQGRHGHLVPAAGQRLLEAQFPGLARRLADAGAVAVPATELMWHHDSTELAWHRDGTDLAWRHDGTDRPLGPDPAPDLLSASGPVPVVLSASQPLLEMVVRHHLLRLRRNVRVVDATAVDGPVITDDRVTGVRVDGAAHHADLVVACTGRNTHFFDQLARHGFPTPEISAVPVDVTYASQLVRRRPGDLDGALAVVTGDPVPGGRIGLMLPLEGDRWMVTLGSWQGEMPPSDPAAYESFARRLASPAIADVLARAEPLGPVLTHRTPTDQRRYAERLDRTPAGFLALGDAVHSGNPIHMYGVTAVAAQARALDQALRRHRPAAPELPRDFYRRAGRAIDVRWRTATGGSFPASTDPGGSVSASTDPDTARVGQ
ncbi:FAD-dependent oxidoreductase [Solwaraspora sp. WMMA2056]|uniref:FAD-dependent oxidoreductase n=1 Tax=Solwaraspora sp. WMMA2056 TaxID=3015161 RepID=UPI00259B0DD8|nr:FAD-dependent oxidoreductase [Solwaraspora sp. WMMA2056]WJK41590.1 FAD-dependent oxidoreductase [Solwaraspora sp. WMMA2056]